MTQPKTARKTSRGRLYEWRSPNAAPDDPPEKFWSVTTLVKGGIPSPALTYWGMKSVAEYAVANHRTLTAMLETVRLQRQNGDQLVISDPDAVQAAVDWLKGSPYRERDRKADLGSAVHAVAEAYVLGQPVPEPEGPAATRIAAFERFLVDWKPEFEMAEASVFNRKFRYAGTLDAIAVFDGGRKLLLDYKTSGSGVYPEAALQLAAYRNAEFVAMPDGTEVPMPEVDGSAVVWLKDDGEYELVPVVTDAKVFTAFRHVIEVFRWVEETSKNVIGQAMPAPIQEGQGA